MNKEYMNMITSRGASLILIYLYQVRNLKRFIYSSFLARKLKLTFGSTNKTIKLLEELGLIRLTDIGKVKEIELTKKGEEIAMNLYYINLKLKNG